MFGDSRSVRDCLLFQKPGFVQFSGTSSPRCPRFLHATVSSVRAIHEPFIYVFKALLETQGVLKHSQLCSIRSYRCSKRYWKPKECSKHSQLSSIRSCKCSKRYWRPEECSKHSQLSSIRSYKCFKALLETPRSVLSIRSFPRSVRVSVPAFPVTQNSFTPVFLWRSVNDFTVR